MTVQYETRGEGSRSPGLSDAIRVAIAATEREDFGAALKIFSPLHTAGQLTSTDALSYYGLCLARGEKRYNLAIKFCQEAISAHFYDSTHYVNLVKVYLAAGSRKRAVETLETGLTRMPKDESLIAMRAAMGYRARPVLKMLRRDNPLNIVLGRIRQKRRSRQAREGGISAATIAWVLPLMIVWIGVLVWLLVKYAM